MVTFWSHLTIICLSSFSVFLSPVKGDKVYLQLDVTPPNVVANLTSDLSVTCRLPAVENVQFAAVSSLILSYASPAVNSQYKEVASVTSGGAQATVNEVTRYQATGRIESGQDNFLTVKVLNPTNDGPGQYMCEIFGLDTQGHPLTTSAATTVELTPVTTDDLLRMLKDLQKNNALLTSEVAALKRNNQSTSQTNAHNLDLNAFLANVTSQLNDMKTLAVDLTKTNATVLEGKINVLASNTSSLSNEIGECKVKTTQLTDLVTQLQSNVTPTLINLHNVYGNNFSDVYDELKHLKENTSTLTQDLDSCKSQNSILFASVSNILKDTTNLSNIISDIQLNQTSLINDISALHINSASLSKINKNEADIVQLSKDIGACCSNMTMLKTQISQQEGRLSALENDLNQYKAQTSVLVSEVAHCQASTSSLLKDMSACKSNSSSLFSEISKLQTNAANIQNQVNHQVSDLTSLANQLNNYKSNTSTTLDYIKGDIHDIQTLITQFNNPPTTANPGSGHVMNTTGLAQFNGHYYYLSSKTATDITAANELCKSMNGYLVEINDRGEWEFLKNYMDSKISDARDYVLVGATDDGHEGQWTFVNSKNQVNFFDWSSTTPQFGELFNCMILLHESVGWRMYMVQCGTQYSRLLCEIPPY